MNMSKEEILINLSEMPMEDKLWVLAKLNLLIKQHEKDNEYKLMKDKYIGTMEKIMGTDFLSGRKHDNVQARIVVATCLIEDGQPLVSIAHILGVDHSTICYYKRVWNAAMKYPKVYSDIISLYNKYRTTL